MNKAAITESKYKDLFNEYLRHKQKDFDQEKERSQIMQAKRLFQNDEDEDQIKFEQQIFEL